MFETYKDRTLVQMKIHANQQRAEIERLRAALQKIVDVDGLDTRTTALEALKSQ